MKKLALLSLLVVSSLASYASNDDFKLTVVHINDHHSHLEPDSLLSVKIGGKSTKIKLGGMAEVANTIKEMKKDAVNPIVVHAGDAITGTLYFTLFSGHADAEVMNAIGFDAFTLGNHEFDAGNEGLKKFLDKLEVPVISYNVVADKSSILNGYWQPYIIKNINGEKVALVGLDVVVKTKNSSSPGKDINFIDEVEAATLAAAEMRKLGVNKVILVSHAGSGKNLEIAEKVSGIDLIVSGDWHTLFAGKELKDMGFPVVYEYPEKVISPDGNPTYVVEGWEYGKFVGNLELTFDSNGVVTSINYNPKVLVQDNFFERKDANGKKYQATGEEKELILAELQANPWISIAKKDAKVAEIVDKYKKEKDLLASQVIGKISGENMPGGSKNRIPGKEGADPRGSIATRFVAETMLSEMRNLGSGDIDFTIQNSGGVRTDINAGDVTFNDAYTYLPFGNTLFVMNIQGSEVKEMLEQAIEYALHGGSTGAFPYGAGIRFEAVETPIAGKRLLKVEIQDRTTGEWKLVEDSKTYKMGTNAYIAGGKDGYFILGKLSKDPSNNPEDTYLPDAESFIKFLKTHPEFKAYTDSNVKFYPAE